MKLIILLFFISCAQEKHSQLAPKIEIVQDSVTWRDERRIYEDSIDVMVAFLWPEKVVTSEQRLAIKQVIATSRKLKPQKESYLVVRNALRLEFERLQCECALNGDCEEGESDEAVDECSEVEEKLSQNNNKLAEFYRLVEVIKENVHRSGGEWLATNLDYPLLPSSHFDLQRSEMKLEVFGDFEKEGEKVPFAYSLPTPAISRSGVMPRLTWVFPRMIQRDAELLDEGLWTIDVVLSEEEQSVVFQGDLFWDHHGKRYRGVIQWEQLKRDY